MGARGFVAYHPDVDPAWREVDRLLDAGKEAQAVARARELTAADTKEGRPYTKFKHEVLTRLGPALKRTAPSAAVETITLRLVHLRQRAREMVEDGCTTVGLLEFAHAFLAFDEAIRNNPAALPLDWREK